MTDEQVAPPSADEAVHATNFGAAGFHVDVEALLVASQALQLEAIRLGGLLSQKTNMLKVGICGPDPISRPAADGFNAKIDPVKQELDAYTQSLKNASANLLSVANDYGATDEQAQAALRTAEGDEARSIPVLETRPALPTSPEDPVHAAVRPYTPPRPTPPRDPGDRSPLINPPSTTHTNPFPDMGILQ
jgi:hypothetical protein